MNYEEKYYGLEFWNFDSHECVKVQCTKICTNENKPLTVLCQNQIVDTQMNIISIQHYAVIVYQRSLCILILMDMVKSGSSTLFRACLNMTHLRSLCSLILMDTVKSEFPTLFRACLTISWISSGFFNKHAPYPSAMAHLKPFILHSKYRISGSYEKDETCMTYQRIQSNFNTVKNYQLLQYSISRRYGNITTEPSFQYFFFKSPH